MIVRQCSTGFYEISNPNPLRYPHFAWVHLVTAHVTSKLLMTVQIGPLLCCQCERCETAMSLFCPRIH